MNFQAAFTDFFKSPKWVMNLLYTSLCMLVPILGQIVTLGWHIEVFWARKDVKFETLPNFDFANFKRYLEKGVWPFLVAFVISIVVMPVLWIILGIPMMILGLTGGRHGHADALIASTSGTLMYVLIVGASILVSSLFMIRAIYCQDFAPAFDFNYAKRAFKLVGKDLILAALIVGVVSVILSSIGMMVFCVGMYVAMAYSAFVWQHLLWQIYNLYLARGGEPIPVSPKLITSSAEPPPAPPAAPEPPANPPEPPETPPLP